MSIELIIYLLLTWIMYIVLEVFIQALIRYGQGGKPIHIIFFILRVMFSIITGVVFNVSNWLEYLLLLLFHVSTYVIIFSPLLSKVRSLYNIVDRSWNYWLIEDGSSIKHFRGHIGLYKFFYFAHVIVCLGAILAITRLFAA
jgi:hypothetical protein